MLVLVDSRNINAEEGIWENALESWVREVAVDDEHRENGKEYIVAKGAEAAVGVQRPDDSVVIFVKEGTVLLQDLERYQYEVKGS